MRAEFSPCPAWPSNEMATAYVRARIAALLRDPSVARNVQRRLDRAADATAATLDGTPPCFRAAGATHPDVILVRGGRCRHACGSIDCLCGAYPLRLSETEVSDGRRFEPLAR